MAQRTMILVDTDILSALAKVDRLSLLPALFPEQEMCVTPGVLAELEHSRARGRVYAQTLFAAVGRGEIHGVGLTPAERSLCSSLPSNLGIGERESIAVAKERDAAVERVTSCALVPGVWDPVRSVA